jgi:glycerophosphoryl diester phosphodiesterase
VGELNWDDIKAVAIGPRGEKVPTLKAVLDELGRHPGKSLLVEIKSYDAGDKALQKRMIAALDKTMGDVPLALRPKIILISFDKEVLRLTKEATHLQNLQRYWLLTGGEIEEAASKGKLDSILSVANEFTGLDIESGPYLTKELKDKKTIVELIQEKRKKVIVWISRRQRTDGLHWLQVARNLGVDIFTSDLPLDVLYPARREARAKDVARFLKTLDPRRKVTGSPRGDEISLGDAAYAFYAPVEADFRGLSPVEREKALVTDIGHLRQDRSGVIVSLADLTQREQKAFLELVRRLPAEVKSSLTVVGFKPPAGSKDPSVIDIPSAKARLKATCGGQARVESL